MQDKNNVWQSAKKKMHYLPLLYSGKDNAQNSKDRKDVIRNISAILKEEEWNNRSRDNILYLAEMNFQDLVEALTNNIIASATS